jgi:hypothetical protein
MDLRHALPRPTSSVVRTTRRTALRGLTAGGLAAGLLATVGFRGSATAAPATQDGTPNATAPRFGNTLLFC